MSASIDCQVGSVASAAIGQTMCRSRKGPGMFPPGSEAIGLGVPRGMAVANRLCPDKNLVRQNASI
ncbi:hypothetical protein CPT34_08295 [Rhizobium sophoriradicis]|uniref:Uncharacterized protein n=1 Tax=Rhizobium sophoriradicis TaxID=1535245 RepID=A0A2A5KX67_9HYPH|nr:hypothetical protein CPT34_08295 [Rhizobium sophoriradicis]